MKVLLLHRDRDFDLNQALPWNAQVLTEDLELNTLLNSMADGDPFVLEVVKKALFTGLQNDCDTILYRQAILADCLKNPAVLRQLYGLATEALDKKKRRWMGVFSHYPAAVLGGSITLLKMLTDMLRILRNVAHDQAGQFTSQGFGNLFAVLQRELGDDYLDHIQTYLSDLEFRKGVLISAELGEQNAGEKFTLYKLQVQGPNWLARMFGRGERSYTFHVPSLDEPGGRILSGLRDQGITGVATTLAQSGDHVLSFFETLRTELAFYMGCLNLHERLRSLDEPICLPTPSDVGTGRRRFSELYDVSLALHLRQRIVGNTAQAVDKPLLVITGANQGGKSTFLRSLGQAQLMMQCGMFVPAESFEADRCTNLFTHYKREEDAAMNRGKFDEELARISEIVDHLEPGAMLLCNESFASTNEREGSEIARQIVEVLLEKQITVCFVTHLYTFAHDMFVRHTSDALFLRAQREPDGKRNFHLIQGEPLETS